MAVQPPYVKGSLKGQSNIDALVYKEPIRRKYLSFNLQNFDVLKNILVDVVPARYMIYNFIIRILESFDGTNTYLGLGTSSNEFGIARVPSNTPRAYTVNIAQGSETEEVLGIINTEKRIYLNLVEAGVRKSTRGSGWLVLETMNMALIDGYL